MDVQLPDGLDEEPEITDAGHRQPEVPYRRDQAPTLNGATEHDHD